MLGTGGCGGHDTGSLCVIWGMKEQPNALREYSFPGFFFFFFFLFIYLFVWLHRLLVAAGGLLSCGSPAL